jgi:hypothetical protein
MLLLNSGVQTHKYFQLCDGIPLHLIEDEVWSEHVTKMRTNKVYGTLSCLYAASECFSATIHVLCSQSDDIHIIPQSSAVCNFFFVFCFLFFVFCFFFVRLVFNSFHRLNESSSLPSAKNTTIQSSWILAEYASLPFYCSSPLLSLPS